MYEPLSICRLFRVIRSTRNTSKNPSMSKDSCGGFYGYRSDTLIGTWTKLSFYDGSTTLVLTYTTTRAGWYGFDNTIEWISPTFSEYTGALRIDIEYMGRSYAVSSITGATLGCSPGNNIIFVSNVCRYDIRVTVPIVVNTPVSSGWGSSWWWSSATPISPPTNVQSGSTLSWSINISKNIISETKNILPKSINDSVLQFKRPKTIFIDSTFSAWTYIIFYRVLPSGREIQVSKTLVLPNGKIRFTPKIAGKYIFREVQK